jgi:hypothetical protein
VVGRDAGGFPDDADPGSQAMGGPGVCVRGLRVFGQPGRDQIARDAVGKVVGQAVQLGAGNRVELVSGDRIGDGRSVLRRTV